MYLSYKFLLILIEFITIIRKCYSLESILLTTLHYNQLNQPDVWIDRLLGNRSVYFHKIRQRDVLDSHAIVPEEIFNSSEAIRKKLPYVEMSNINCSLELLGYLEVDRYHGFNLSSKELGPMLGENFMKLNISNDDIRCYYRVLYENWRAETTRTNPNFWSIIFYCPIQNVETCNTLTSMTLNPINSIISLTLKLNNLITNYSTSLYKNPLIFQSNNQKSKLGVCVAIPYSSSDPEKIAANGAMLYTWAQYYLKLGFYVFIYDRSGMNYNYLFPKGKQKNLIYYNYTMRELLNPNEKFDYDNTEVLVDYRQIRHGKSRQVRQGIQGFDKVLTLTRCRFDARAIYNITDMIVADFDEFLYCPLAREPTALAQSNYMTKLVDKAKSKGYEQITFTQRILLNTSISTRDCMINKVSGINPSNMTKAIDIFNCFAPYEYKIGGHSIKSFHIGYACPLTGYHQACATASPRAYECNCNNLVVKGDECAFVHITSNPADYIKGVGKFTDNQIANIKNQINELYKVYESISVF